MSSTPKSIKAAAKKAFAPNKKITKRSMSRPTKSYETRENSVKDLNAELTLNDFTNDPNIPAYAITPSDGKATLENDGNYTEEQLTKIRKSVKLSNKNTKKPSQSSSDSKRRTESNQVMVYDIDLETDSDLVILIKREINRMEITPNDIYELIGSEECPFLLRRNDAWNLIYSLRTRSHITYENALKWSVILNKTLVAFVIDDDEYPEFIATIQEKFPHLVSDCHLVAEEE